MNEGKSPPTALHIVKLAIARSATDGRTAAAAAAAAPVAGGQVLPLLLLEDADSMLKHGFSRFFSLCVNLFSTN